MTMTEKCQAENKITKKYIFSHNGEDSWTFDKRKAVCAAIAETGKKEAVKAVCIYRGEVTRYTHHDFTWDIAEDVIEDMQVRAIDYGGEQGEDYLTDLTKEDEEDLSRLITEWMDAHAEQPSFCTVDHVKPFQVEVKP